MNYKISPIVLILTLFAFQVLANPCEDLHQYFCSSNKTLEDISLNAAYQTYRRGLEEGIKKLGTDKAYDALIAELKIPLISSDQENTDAAIDQVLKSKGKQELADFVTNFLVKSKLVDLKELTYGLYYAIRKLSSQLDHSNPQLLKLEHELSSKPGGLLKVSDLNSEFERIFSRTHEILAPEEFSILIKYLVHDVRRIRVEKPAIEDLSVSSSLIAQITNEAQLDRKFASVRKLYFELISNFFELKPALISKKKFQVPLLYLHRIKCKPSANCLMELVSSLTDRSGVFAQTSVGPAIGIGLAFLDEPGVRQFTVLAHEFAHYLQRAGFLGSNEVYQKCLAERTGAGIHQMEETAADAFAAEMLAHRYRFDHLDPQPLTQRSVAEGSVYFCQARRANEHLEPFRRTNFVFMANPILRDIFQCPKGSGPKYCGSILDNIVAN